MPIGRAEEVEEVFDAISYCKGASVVRMVHAVVGAATHGFKCPVWLQVPCLASNALSGFKCPVWLQMPCRSAHTHGNSRNTRGNNGNSHGNSGNCLRCVEG